jgi:UDPglucose 6-dehydrogenase
VAQGADVLVLITEWNEFRALDLTRVAAAMNAPVLVDLRNVYRPADVRAAGFHYSSIGRA